MREEKNSSTGKKGIKNMSIEVKKVVTADSNLGRLLRFLFQPPRLGPVPPNWVATEFAGLPFFNQFAARLAQSPPDLVTHLGMVRANAYFEAGCPLELCDHAAARDVWRVIHQDVIGKEPVCH
jgi:hypothetical protein